MSAAAPYRQVIVGTDGSPTAARAVAAACHIVQKMGIPLVVATAWFREPPNAPVRSELAQLPDDFVALQAGWAESTAFGAASQARDAGIDAKAATPQGNAADALLRLAEDRPGSLIVVGSVGLGSRAERILGNIPNQVLHHATDDVLVIRTDAPNSGASDWVTLAVGTDGSPTAAKAVARAIAFGTAMGIAPTLVTVAPDDAKASVAFDRTISKVPAARDVPRRIVDIKHAATGLIDIGDEYDLLVTGNKGMSGPSRLLGSVPNSVTRQLPTDFLLVNTTRS